MNNKEAKDRLISLKMSYKIRIEEEDIEALDVGAEALENQKTGHWILDEQSSVGGMYKCSECGRLLYRFREDNLLEKYPYCHCGAKMEGENNEDSN